MTVSTPARAHQAVEQDAVADIADDQLGLRRHRPIEAGGQVVENDDPLAASDQLQNHMAADKAGAAGDQNAHAAQPRIRGLWTDR